MLHHLSIMLPQVAVYSFEICFSILWFENVGLLLRSGMSYLDSGPRTIPLS
jgi:hypothetical protein